MGTLESDLEIKNYSTKGLQNIWARVDQLTPKSFLGSFS
jgi:hypothetical protein